MIVDTLDHINAGCGPHQENAMRTRRLLQPIILAATLVAGLGSAHAQTFSLNWNPRSGDVWVDTQLADVNRYGSRYRDPFIDEMVRYHDAPRDLVTDLLVNRNWAPGDVYYACTLAQVIGRPCGYVAGEWQQHHGEGWGAMAKRLGIKPGSAEFHRLKKGFVPTYDRWSRPINLDADLQRVYPNRGKAKGVVTGNKHPDGKIDKGPKDSKGAKGNNGQGKGNAKGKK